MAELSIVLLDARRDGRAARAVDGPVDGPTDVMAFPMDVDELASEHADPTASAAPRRQRSGRRCSATSSCARRSRPSRPRHAGHSTEAELHLLCTHGILHLLGYDHGEPEEEREMFELQARLVGGWAERSGRGPIRAPLPGNRRRGARHRRGAAVAPWLTQTILGTSSP